MNILFFDCETTGKAKDFKRPMTDVDNWPRLVQVGVIGYCDGVENTMWEDIVKPEGFVIPDEVAAIHHITTERAMTDGIDLTVAINNFMWLLEQCDVVAGHNVSFDVNVMGAEFIRRGQPNPFEGKTIIDTMKSSTEFCAIPGPYGYKWPTQLELWHKLFPNRPYGQTHTALDDVQHCAECYFELIRLGVIKEPIR